MSEQELSDIVGTERAMFTETLKSYVIVRKTVLVRTFSVTSDRSPLEVA